PATLVARDLRTEVRAGSWPGTLPPDRGFRSDARDLASAYEAGWTACRFVAARVGTAGLVRLYRLVGPAGAAGEKAAEPSVLRRARAVARAEGGTAVWFGAAAPLGLLAPALRRAGLDWLVASTHGHEAGWAMLPGARALLRRIGSGLDVVTYLGDYTRT